MFGYVRTAAPELRVKENEYYKGTYCGLCKAMGRCTGQCSRLTLNYDFVVFALLRFALCGEQTSFSQKRCILHPLKRRNIMNKNPQLDHCAYASALMSYHKVRDDIADERFFKRLMTRVFLLPTAAGMRRRTVKKKSANGDSYAELDRSCEEKLQRLAAYEKDTQKEPSVDLPAQMFGEILGEFLAFGLDGANKRIAHTAGLHLGRWIYVADALDDVFDDARLERFNPILALYGGRAPLEHETDGITVALKNELIELENALDLIDYKGNTIARELIRNIIYLGMPEKIEKILEKFKSKDTDHDNDRKDKDK